MRERGEANDYVGKGIHGGEIVVVLDHQDADFVAADSSIVGNACLYGATGGDFHANGRTVHENVLLSVTVVHSQSLRELVIAVVST